MEALPRPFWSFGEIYHFTFSYSLSLKYEKRFIEFHFIVTEKCTDSLLFSFAFGFIRIEDIACFSKSIWFALQHSNIHTFYHTHRNRIDIDDWSQDKAEKTLFHSLLCTFTESQTFLLLRLSSEGGKTFFSGKTKLSSWGELSLVKNSSHPSCDIDRPLSILWNNLRGQFGDSPEFHINIWSI